MGRTKRVQPTTSSNVGQEQGCSNSKGKKRRHSDESVSYCSESEMMSEADEPKQKNPKKKVYSKIY